jgi:hypothetical protein
MLRFLPVPQPKVQAMLLNILLLQGPQHLMFQLVLPVFGCWLLLVEVEAAHTQPHTVEAEAEQADM